MRKQQGNDQRKRRGYKAVQTIGIAAGQPVSSPVLKEREVPSAIEGNGQDRIAAPKEGVGKEEYGKLPRKYQQDNPQKQMHSRAGWRRVVIHHLILSDAFVHRVPRHFHSPFQ